MTDTPAQLEVAVTGGLCALTLYPSGARWQASTRWRGSDGWYVQIADTPTEAVSLALQPPLAAPTPQPTTGSIFD